MSTSCALSAHVGYLFAERPLIKRFEAAKAAGFDAVEHPAPFEIPANEMARLLQDNGLRLAQISSGLGQTGEKGLAAIAGRQAEFRDGFARALDYAEATGCPLLHPMAGTGGDAETYRANLEVALTMAQNRPVEVLVEAISNRAVPGYFMASIDDLLALAASEPRLRVLIDTFHAVANNWNPADAICAAGPSLGHVHIADFPTRAEPGTGQIDFAAVLKAIAASDFSGAIGFEYIPSDQDRMDWLTGFQTSVAVDATQNRSPA